jgi:CHAT domain-containing protein
MSKPIAFLVQLFIGVCLVLLIGLNHSSPAADSTLTSSSPSSTNVTTIAAEVDQQMQQGRSAYQAGRYVEAIALWQQAFTTYQAQDDGLNQAIALNALSLAHQQLGNWSEATTAITDSLELLQAHQNRNVNHSLLGQAFNTQGSLQFAQGQTEQALESWKDATTAYTTAGDVERRLGSLINQAQAQQALGLFLQARQTLNEVERSLQQQPDSELKAIGLHSLGNVLLQVGNLPDAQRVLQQSLAIAELSAPQHISAVLLSLGNLARTQQDFAGAVALYQQAADRAIAPVTLQALLNQLSLLITLEQRSQAQALVPQIQSQIGELPSSRVTIDAQINLAQSLLNLQPTSLTEPAQILATAIQQAQNLSDRRAEAYALGHLGGVYEQVQQWSEAQKLTEQALLIAQTINAPDIAYQWQWQLGRILKAQQKVNEATQAYTAAFDSLQSIRSDLLSTNPDLQFSFRESVEPVYRQLADLLLQRTSSEPNQENLKQARAVIESLQIAELDNFFRTACLESQAIAIDQINQTAVAVVYPIILPDRLEVILSLPDQPLRQYTTTVSQAEIEETLDSLRSNLEKPFTALEGKVLGQQVYNWLINPLQSDLAQNQIKTLVFVLDGALRNVPIAALYDGQQYLIEQYSIALAPGLQLLDPRSLAQIQLEVLAAGLTEERHGFGALLNVRQELADIEAEVSSRVLLNEAFTSDALQAQINTLPFSIVHLATHGQFSSDVDRTFILAWDKPITVNELTELLQTQDANQTEAIELLVLSACETASGDDRAALGLAGVAVKAGARSTLASLWSLDDESSAKLISEFYRELTEATVTKAEALRRAQLTLLRDPSYRHPIYWAPFVLVGNWL